MLFSKQFRMVFFWKNVLLRGSFCVQKLGELFDVRNVQLLEQTIGHTQTLSDKILTLLVYATRLLLYRKCAIFFSSIYSPWSITWRYCLFYFKKWFRFILEHSTKADYYALNELNLSSCESKSKFKPKSNTQIQFEMGFLGGSKFMKRN